MPKSKQPGFKAQYMGTCPFAVELSRQINIRVSDVDLEALDRAAFQRKVSWSECIRQLVHEAAEKAGAE